MHIPLNGLWPSAMLWLAAVAAFAQTLPEGAAPADQGAAAIERQRQETAATECQGSNAARCSPQGTIDQTAGPPSRERKVRPISAAALPSEPTMLLREVRFEGGEGLPRDGLEPIYRPFIGQAVTLADLEELRYRLTKHYVDQGYLNSGMIFKPGQTANEGVVVFQIIAGHLSEIRVNGQGRLRASYLTGRLNPDTKAPFNRNELQERFQRLLQDPLIERLNGTLIPGPEPGTAILDLAVTRARPWELYLRTDNYRPPSTGSNSLYIGGTLRNLNGFGDALELYLGHGYTSEGKEGAIGWALPLNARNTRLSLRYDRSDASPLEEPLDELDIESETRRFELALSHPLWETSRDSLALRLAASLAINETRLLGIPFSFSEGSVDGESKVAAVRLVQEYTQRSPERAFALRSTASLGVDALGATIHAGDIPDSRFFAWLGQGQAVWRLADRGTQLILRASIQLAGEPLLALERFAVGGADTVRGYRENTLVGDSGYVFSLEVRHPLWEGKVFGDTLQQLQLAAFADAGGAWRHGQFSVRDEVASIGIGAIWTVQDRLRAECYYGYALEDRPEHTEHDLQDDGIHFRVQADF
ncbi:ShlB/FhaC/HecB family hemolysin secretion/activation protein [Caldichromatium japonicum]|uniref:ShlB/FhaC/HecB family hemolysin secretion/activation protein n=1 Tax=Caldichromatium japonicum TaxID=2699430 RepID=A0A6G7VEL2_9GAMM|nr:ShlB/FhaC/HecB family hemolysin secretion/activation protein [Caldichromatium japonicum]QIK38325.1 ShlB/FhaC/HecB family hemolysin secretion/activation protein [Caldichromatium japonicum]